MQGSTARRFSRARETITNDELAHRLRTLALEALMPGAKRSIGALSAAVLAAYDIAVATNLHIELDPIATGSVALASVLSAPIGIRAVVRDRTLAPSDADWHIGHGPEINGTAASILLFLAGRTGFPTPESEPT